MKVHHLTKVLTAEGELKYCDKSLLKANHDDESFQVFDEKYFGQNYVLQQVDFVNGKTDANTGPNPSLKRIRFASMSVQFDM